MLKIEEYKRAIESGELKELPHFSNIGGYHLYYITSFGNILCPRCANNIIDDIHEDIISHDITYEHTLYCDYCSRKILPSF